jgi:hypothetical protein
MVVWVRRVWNWMQRVERVVKRVCEVAYAIFGLVSYALFVALAVYFHDWRTLGWMVGGPLAAWLVFWNISARIARARAPDPDIPPARSASK